MSAQPAQTLYAPVIENAAAKGRIVLVCEHASNHIPDAWGDLGLTRNVRLISPGTPAR